MAKKTNTPTAPVNRSTDIVPVGKGGIVGHLVGKTIPYASPWIGASVLPPLAGLATNAMWGADPLTAGLASAGVALSGVALSTVTWKASGGNNAFRRVRRAHATASVAAGMGWLTCATAAGPFGRPLLDLWLMGGGLFAASWNIRQIMRNAHDETEQPAENGGGLDKLRAAIGLEKATVKEAKGTGKGTVKAPLEVLPGATVQDVQSAAPRIAAAMDVPPSGVVITPSTDSAAEATLAIRVADLLKDGVDFIPPREMGLLPTDPIPVGLYADGEEWLINPFFAAILQHLLVMGVTGAGKSEFLRNILGHLATRRQLSVILVDLAKGRQSVGHMTDGLDWFIRDKAEAKRLFKALPGAIKARGDQLADEGLDQWTPASSLNAVVMWIEEAADVVDFDQLDDVARKARSVGIWLVISLQRATWTNLSTDVRANLQASACFGVDDAGDAGFCLPDHVVEAGAVPAWGSDRPGYAFATGMGIGQDRWTTEARTGLTDREYMHALVAAGAPYRDPLDDVTAAAFGQVYAQRTHRGTNRLTPGVAEAAAALTTATAPAAVPAAPVPAALTSAPATHHFEDQEGENDMDDRAEEELQEAREAVLGLIPADPEPGADYANVSLESALPDVDEAGSMAFSVRERVSTEDARAILYGELDDWVRTGRLEFEPADLIPATVAAARTRPWLQGELKKLAETGVLRRDGHGAYTLIASPLQPA